MRRFNFSDIARGLAILYIIQCHVCNYHLAWIDSWAMPVFFVIMGIFQADINLERNDCKKNTYNLITVCTFINTIIYTNTSLN